MQVGVATRSALVMAVAAAEIGYKRAVAVLTPEAEWLVMQMPSPSLERLLREHLPQLPVLEKLSAAVACPENILKQLKVAVTLRNTLVHSGSGSISRERVERIIDAVDDLLLLLDFYCGHQWSLRFLTQETRDALGIQEGGRPTPGVSYYVQQGEAANARSHTVRIEDV